MHWMYQNGWRGEGPWDLVGMDPLFFMGIMPLLMVWALFWKGWALYLAARRGEIVWFIVLLIVNTFGILEIIYIFAVAKRSDTKEVKTEAKPQEKPQEKKEAENI